MRTIRQILLTEYIGAIVVALLIADSFTALFTTLVAQVSYHLRTPVDSRGLHGLSSTYSVLETLTRVALYLLSAYLLARWLYPARMEIARRDAPVQEDQKNEGRM